MYFHHTTAEGHAANPEALSCTMAANASDIMRIK